MAGFTHSQLKNKSFDEVQKAFDKTMGWIDSFVSMDFEVVKGDKEKDKGSVTRAKETSSKRAGTELEQERINKQKIDDDQEEAEMKKYKEIVVDEEEIVVDAIPLATKPPIIVDWKIIKEGKMGYFQLIRADGSSKRNTRPEEAYERVLWGDLKVMFEPDVESEVWRNLQGYNVTVWKLFSSGGVHFEEMDLETAQTTTTAKLPILKQGEYDMWRLRIEQYFQVQDYALWDVIENGNSFKPVPQTTTNVDGSSTPLIPGLVTTEEKAQKKNDVKARRFGGNEATKKTQKTLLKQMYENFSAPSTKSLDSIFNRL
ncbi:hypothetical protein Tco_1400239 [Tanacetum coccineum]